jgi:hypothetical protein
LQNLKTKTSRRRPCFFSSPTTESFLSHTKPKMKALPMVSPRSLTSFLRHVFISFLNKGREPLLLVGRPDPSPQVLMSNDSFVHNEPTRLNHHGLVLSWLFLPPFFHELPNKSRKAKSRKNKNVQLFFFFLTIPSRLRCVRHHTCNRMNLWPVKFHCNEKEKRGAKLRHLYTLDNRIC